MVYKKNWITLLIFCFVSCLLTVQASAQRISGPGSGVDETRATSTRARKEARKQAPKKTHYRYIIKSNSKHTLKGNKCFEAVTHHFGFEYLIAPQDLPPNTSGFKRWIHNFGVKFILFFRNGPGWQLRLKKRYEECKYRYGDFVG